MIKVANSIQKNTNTGFTTDFKRFSNTRLLPYKDFNFAPVKNLNFDFCLRLEFLLNIYLKNFLDDKMIKFYTDFLRRESNKLIYSILKESKNFKIIVKDFRENKFTYVKFLTEAFYLLKKNSPAYQRMHHYLNKYGLMDYFLITLNNLKYEQVEQNIFIMINLPWLKKKNNFVDFLELIMLYIYKNRECFFLKVMPASSAISKSSIVKFIFTMPFQVNFPVVDNLVIKIMEIMLFNINKLSDSPDTYKKMYSTFLYQVIDKHNLFGHKNFLKILEMLIKNKEDTIIRDTLAKVNFWPVLDGCIDFKRKKKTCISGLKVLSYFLEKKCYKVDSDEMTELIKKCIRYLVRHDCNILSSCIRKFFQFIRRKIDTNTDSDFYLSKEGLSLLQEHIKTN